MHQEQQPIRYGVFIMPVHPPEKPLEQSLDEDLEFVVLAEELGFSEFWIGEHHTSSVETIVMPELFIAKALAMTQTIRIGPAPVCLQYHHPGHVASRLALLDHLSHGRLNICFGPSALRPDLEFYGIDPGQSAAMVAEALEIIMLLWMTDPPYDFQGQFWNLRLEEWVRPEIGAGHVHRPLQKPHPPIFMPITSRNSGTAKAAGKRGFLTIPNPMVTSDVIADIWKTYEAAALEAGHQPKRSDWHVARSVFVAETTREAQDRARNGSVAHCYQYIGELLDGTPSGRELLKRDPATPDHEVDIDYYMNDQIIAGDPDEVVRRLVALVEETGPFGTLVIQGFDWDDKASWLRCLELFAREVMPAFNREVSGTTAGAF